MPARPAMMSLGLSRLAIARRAPGRAASAAAPRNTLANPITAGSSERSPSAIHMKADPKMVAARARCAQSNGRKSPASVPGAVIGSRPDATLRRAQSDEPPSDQIVRKRVAVCLSLQVALDLGRQLGAGDVTPRTVGEVFQPPDDRRDLRLVLQYLVEALTLLGCLVDQRPDRIRDTEVRRHPLGQGDYGRVNRCLPR